MGRKLAAFDFDHTIVDDNSDIVVRNLISKELIPESVKKLYKSDGWTAYMQGVFETLHVNGITENNIISAMNKVPSTPGMEELIRTMTEELNYDVIIISDSNTYLINSWLDSHHLKDKVMKVFTNPANFSKGVLRISMYHLQTECKLSTKNLCKGKILDEFIAARAQAGVVYDRIVYAGDGNNDFCPILRLSEHDLACVRDKYACLQLVQTVQAGKPIPVTGQIYNIKAKIVVWNSGTDILNAIKNLD